MTLQICHPEAWPSYPWGNAPKGLPHDVVLLP
jgi:hypothetical protein